MTGAGRAKRLETAQRHEQKGKRKLFFNKAKSDLDWTEKREFDQGGASRLGVTLFPDLGGSFCYSFSYVCISLCIKHIYIHKHIHIYIHRQHTTYTHTYIFFMNISHNKAKKMDGTSSCLFKIYPKPTL